MLNAVWSLTVANESQNNYECYMRSSEWRNRLKRSLNITTFSNDGMPGNCQIWHLARILLVTSALLLAPTQVISQEYPYYHLLAEKDAGRSVARGDVTIVCLLTIIPILAKNLNTTETEFADQSYGVTEALRKRGIDEKLLDILEAFNDLATRFPLFPKYYPSWAEAYIDMRSTMSMSHTKALKFMEYELKTFGKIR